MVNRADKAWDAFFDFFESFDGTPADIAAVFNAGTERELVTATQIRDWRRRHSRPQLTQLPELGHLWNGDPLFFARLLGAIPTDGLDAELWLQRRIVELRVELHGLETDVRGADTTEATGQVVAAATASGKWAVAVHPAVEGPTGIPIHVADRLDFRPVDAHMTGDREELETDLAATFARTHAIYAPRMPSTWDMADATDLPLRYSVAHTTANFAPTRLWDHVGVPSLAVVSQTLGTWPIDVGALVARILGYGFVSTRALSRSHRPHGRIPTPVEAAGYRAERHQELLKNPWHRYVWGHVGGEGVDPRTYFPPKLAPGLKIVWLRETDDLIEGMSLDDKFRQEQQILADRAGTKVLEIACESAGLGKSGLREPRWNRAFRIAAEIVEQLMSSGDVQPTALATSIRELT
ncbi:MAG: hypothetical protein JHC79_22170, partial [Williamsia sp.]|nr:hypothetical protein [Williamsia sp.]